MPLPTTKPDVPGNAPLARLFPNAPAPKHKVVLVNFWAGWCVHCRAELPVLEKLRGQLRAAHLDAEILGVCEPSSFPADRDAILKNLQLTIPQARATAPDLVAYGVQAYPTSLLFVNGQLVERKTGAQSMEKLVEWLRRYGVRVPKGKG
jgi:thiol-disulfide isomerase/thioredoxin